MNNYYKICAAMISIALASAGLPAAYAQCNIEEDDTSVQSSLSEETQQEIVSSGECGEDATWTLYDNGTLIVSGTGDTYSYYHGLHGHAPGWEYCSTAIKNIVISEGITSIGTENFYYTDSLESLSLPSTLESLGLYNFYSCPVLTDVFVSEGCSCKVTLKQCPVLKSLSIPSSVKELLLQNVESLENLTINDGLDSLSIDNAPALKSLSLPEGLTSLDLCQCDSLSSLDIPSTVKSIEVISCANIESLALPEGVTTLEQGAFRFCSNLTSISLPSTLTEIGSACFYKCENLTSIDIPDGITLIPYACFYGCKMLESVGLPSSLNVIEGREVSGAGLFYDDSFAKYGAFENCSSLKEINLPEGLSRIGSYAFSGCANLKSVIVPSSVEAINEKAFYGCSDLEYILLETSISASDIGDDAFNEIGYASTISVASREQYESLYGVTRIYSPTRTELVIRSVSPTDPVEAFAWRLYVDVLDRKTDPRVDDAAGYATQVNALHNGWQPAEIAYNYFNSAEYAEKKETSEQTVRRVYRVMFGREADEEGLAYWVSYLESGMSVRAVIQGFSQSDEYHAYYCSIGLNDATISATTLSPRDRNLGVTMFVYRLYVEGLGRAHNAVCEDAVGLDVQTGAILSGTSAGQIAQNIFSSEEFTNRALSRADQTRTIYRVMLNREAEESEIPYWESRMIAGEEIDSIVYGFSQSDEFSKLCATYGVKPR